MGGGDAWASVLEVNDIVVSVAIATVCASIGLQIRVRTLLDVGWRVVVTAGVAWVTTAGLSLGLLVAALRGEPQEPAEPNLAQRAAVRSLACSPWLVLRSFSSVLG